MWNCICLIIPPTAIRPQACGNKPHVPTPNVSLARQSHRIPCPWQTFEGLRLTPVASPVGLGVVDFKTQGFESWGCGCKRRDCAKENLEAAQPSLRLLCKQTKRQRPPRQPRWPRWPVRIAGRPRWLRELLAKDPRKGRHVAAEVLADLGGPGNSPLPAHPRLPRACDWKARLFRCYT